MSWKVTAFVGSACKKGTCQSYRKFLQHLQTLGDIDYEIIALNDCHLNVCRGCKACFERGEEFYPFQDDRDQLIDKMRQSDVMVFASPNYSFHVCGLYEDFLGPAGL